MNKTEFTSLPLSLALGCLYDANERELAMMPKPETAKPPKFDQRIRRKDGYMWASETDAAGLKFWLDRALQPGKPEFAEKNAKDAKGLGYWLKWREENPQAIWQGERNRDRVTAAPPSSHPEVFEWEPRAGAPAAQSKLPSLDDDTDPIPF